MTTEHTTEPSAISRRTILRTTANAAWMVPAISIASAVPAMAACSTDTAIHFGISNTAGERVPGSVTLGSWQQTHVVTQIGGPGTATITLKRPGGLANNLLGGWNIPAPAGWTSAGVSGVNHRFTKAFAACTAPQAVTFTVQYSVVSGVVTTVQLLLDALGLLSGGGKVTASISPN